MAGRRSLALAYQHAVLGNNHAAGGKKVHFRDEAKVKAWISKLVLYVKSIQENSFERFTDLHRENAPRFGYDFFSPRGRLPKKDLLLTHPT
jgi:hypothetical protein